MFTWICPQCGREVPPAYTECPDCAAKAASAAPPQPPQQPGYPPPPLLYPQQGYPQQPYPPQPYPPPQYPPSQYPQQPPYGQPPQYQQPPYPPPPQYAQPPYQQPVYQQPAYAPPPPPPPPPPVQESRESAAPSVAAEPPREAPRGSALFGAPPAPVERSGGMPTWLLTILCTTGFAALVVGAYWLFGTHRAAAPSATVESPAAKPGAAVSPYQKFIEVSGVRFQEDPKHKGKILVKFIVTNHSESNLGAVSGNVTIWAGTKKSDEDAQGSFAFTTDVGPYDSKEATAPFNTKLKVYELPDWNVMNTDLQITAPGGSGSGGLP